MDIFNLIINIIEALCISVIISTGLNKSKLYIVFQTIVITLITTFYNYDNMTFILICSIILVAICVTYILYRKIKLVLISQAFLAILADSFCNLIALLVISVIQQQPISLIADNDFIFIEAIILSKILFLLFAILIFIFNFRFSESRVSFIILLMLIVTTFMVHGLTDAVVYGDVGFGMLQLLSVYFIIFVVLFIAFIHMTSLEFENSMKSQRLAAQAGTIRNNLMLLESVSSKIDFIEHQMNYVLLMLKYKILQKDDKSAIDLIDSNIWKMKQMPHYVNTKNPYFDTLFAGILGKLAHKKISPIIIVDVKKDELDRNISLINQITELMDVLYEVLDEKNKIKISIQSKKNYISFSLIVSGISEKVALKIRKKVVVVDSDDIHFAVKKLNDDVYEFICLFFEVVK